MEEFFNNVFLLLLLLISSLSIFLILLAVFIAYLSGQCEKRRIENNSNFVLKFLRDNTEIEP